MISHGNHDVLTGRQRRASTAPMLTDTLTALKSSTRFGCYMLRRTGRSEVFCGESLGINMAPAVLTRMLVCEC